MKELIEYKNNLKSKNLEQLLDELMQINNDKNYHRLCSRNKNLEEECNQKIFIIKIMILEKYDREL